MTSSIASQTYCSTGYIISIQVQITAIMHFILATGFVDKVFRRPCKPIGIYQHEKGKKSNALDETCLVCLRVSCVCSVSTLLPDYALEVIVPSTNSPNSILTSLRNSVLSLSLSLSFCSTQSAPNQEEVKACQRPVSAFHI